ncbi:MAG TPA: hypothetical protein VKM55_16895 [Candidatus Lokiarchaeia archaeon]|nr:hypothetical protein [Candidatus Lokiarchaeia archaeon]
MSEKNLENFLKKLEDEKHETGDKDEEKLVIVQGIVEKILNYVFSSIEMTSNRIANLESGISNITGYLSQQLNDLTGRLRQLPGMQALSDVQMPGALNDVQPPEISGGMFMQALEQFIVGKTTEIQASRVAAVPANQPEIGTDEEEPKAEKAELASSATSDEIEQKRMELEAREKHLSLLADQLAVKSQQLQERENTIDILESGMQDRLKMTAAMKIVAQDKKSEVADSTGTDLDELSKLSESIMQGDQPEEEVSDEDADIDEETLKKLVDSADNTDEE